MKGRLNKGETVLDLLAGEFSEAKIALNFSTPLELLVATILSAQCTDDRVNRVTPDLFKRYRSARDYAEADQAELEAVIKPTGFYRNKAKSIINCCRKLLEDFNGEVPDRIDELTTLPGVGRKTANVVLGAAFGKNAIAVDTHVKRVANRLGLTDESDPERIEMDLRRIIPEARWTEATMIFILHGRHTCTARKPKCANCAVRSYCDYFKKELQDE